MPFRIIGALLVIGGCSAAGFLFALNSKKETQTLKSIIELLEYWKNELSFHLTPLPELCIQAAARDQTILGKLMGTIANELERQISSDVETCILAALQRFPDFPPLSKQILETLGRSLGKFDLEGQINGIDSVLKEANRLYEQHLNLQDVRLRNYKTLGICAGVAIAILFI